METRGRKGREGLKDNLLLTIIIIILKKGPFCGCDGVFLLTLDFVQVALLVFSEQVGVCVFPGVHFPHKQGFEPAVLPFSVA